jgi:hypothetical protein
MRQQMGPQHDVRTLQLQLQFASELLVAGARRPPEQSSRGAPPWPRHQPPVSREYNHGYILPAKGKHNSRFPCHRGASREKSNRPGNRATCTHLPRPPQACACVLPESRENLSKRHLHSPPRPGHSQMRHRRPSARAVALAPPAAFLSARCPQEQQVPGYEQALLQRHAKHLLAKACLLFLPGLQAPPRASCLCTGAPRARARGES